jgi:hypothetical protein
LRARKLQRHVTLQNLGEELRKLARPDGKTSVAISETELVRISAIDNIQWNAVRAVVSALNKRPFIVDDDDLLMRRAEIFGTLAGARRRRHSIHALVQQFVKQILLLLVVDIEHQLDLDAALQGILHELDDVRRRKIVDADEDRLPGGVEQPLGHRIGRVRGAVCDDLVINGERAPSLSCTRTACNCAPPFPG